jgi:two-component sensor histidine kinase
MKNTWKSLFENYWPSLFTGPVFVLIGCRYLYGDAYFASMSNFLRMTLVWMCVMLILSGGSLWVRSVMLNRFPKLDDWGKRITFTLVGYLGFAAIPSWTIFQLLKVLPFPELRGDETRFFILWIIPIIITVLYATVYECITYFSKWKEAIAEAEQLEKLNLESQFRSLQSQLNPHFLFNSFNVLSSLIAEDPRRAEDFVDELSNVYRYLLRSNEQELAKVSDELRFIRSFFHLLQTRHDTGIALKIDVSPQIASKKIPALALQVLVENAVKHNEISPEKPLLIAVYAENDTALMIKNNIQVKQTKSTSNRVGLENLRQRYELLGISSFSVADDGHFFTVSLPVLE